MITSQLETETADVPADIPPEAETNNPAGKRPDATIWQRACIIASSRDFPECRTPEKAAVRIMAGHECGIGEVASVMGIRFQNGRMSMDAGLVAGVIQRSPQFSYRVKDHGEQSCSIQFFETATEKHVQPILLGESVFTWADALKAGLAGKDVWKAYPRNMIFARALTNGARWYTPGLFNGAIYSHEELGYSVDEDGRAVGEGGDTSGGGSDLCTRETRGEIRGLLEKIGIKEPDFCKMLAIKMLDELSQYEADKQIKALAKKAAKIAKEGKQQPPASGQSKDDAPTVKAAESAAAAKDTAPPLATTPAKETLVQAFAESQQPSTPIQHQRIFDAAEKLEPNETACREMLKRWLTKRGVASYKDLSFGQAEALAETAEKAVADVQPPFDAPKHGQ